MTPHPSDRLSQSLAGFMRYFLVHIDPILHRTVYRGRTYTGFEVIVPMALGTVGALRPTDLSRGLKIDKASLTAVLRRLRERGVIDRENMPGDERSYRVRLTEEGRRFVAHMDAQRLDRFRSLFATIETDELDAVSHGLDLISAHLRLWEETHAQPATQAPDTAAAAEA